MQKIRIALVLCSVLFSFSAFAQFSVSGKIIDSATREPLAGASVYCQNTTVGTVTTKDGQFSLSLRSGGYEMIISYTGYKTKLVRISHTDGVVPDIEMTKEEVSMGEVIIKSSNEVPDGLAKYGKFFLDHFIGTTPNAAKTKLLNPEVLKFFFLKRSNKLRVLATEPLQIENTNLGYNIRYQLDSFVYYYNTDINLYTGYTFFSALEGSDSMQNIWNANRRKAYNGSKLQFMRSYYDSTLNEDGWTISLLDETNAKKFNKVENPYDTTYYGALDSTLQVEIIYPRKISVAFSRKPEPEYIKQFKLPANVPIQLSYIDMKDAIAIQENGYYYDQKDWINQGYWSWKNLADLLPYDYLP